MAIVSIKLFEAANATITLTARVDEQTNKLVGVTTVNSSPSSCYFKVTDDKGQSEELTLPGGGTFNVDLSHGMVLPKQGGVIDWNAFTINFRWPA